jgi:hypothetical protein
MQISATVKCLPHRGGEFSFAPRRLSENALFGVSYLAYLPKLFRIYEK